MKKYTKKDIDAIFSKYKNLSIEEQDKYIDNNFYIDKNRIPENLKEYFMECMIKSDNILNDIKSSIKIGSGNHELDDLIIKTINNYIELDPNYLLKLDGIEMDITIEDIKSLKGYVNNIEDLKKIQNSYDKKKLTYFLVFQCLYLEKTKEKTI